MRVEPGSERFALGYKINIANSPTREDRGRSRNVEKRQGRLQLVLSWGRPVLQAVLHIFLYASGWCPCQ